MVPILIIVAATLFFFILERVVPGRELPEAPGWFVRVALMSGCQLGIVVLAGLAWEQEMQRWSLFHMSVWMSPCLRDFLGGLLARLFSTGGIAHVTTLIFSGGLATRFITVRAESNC